MVVKDTELVISVESAGKLLGVCRGTAYKLVKEGKIPIIKLGRRFVVPRPALLKMLENAGNKGA